MLRCIDSFNVLTMGGMNKPYFAGKVGYYEKIHVEFFFRLVLNETCYHR